MTKLDAQSNSEHATVRAPQRPQTPWEHVALFLATGFGIGWIPVAPGTFGSLWGLPLVWLLQHGVPLPGGEAARAPFQWVAGVAIFLIGIPLCGTAARLIGRADPGPVVWDEIAAFPVVFAFVTITPLTAVLGFLLFRIFDVWKPWPAYRLEYLPGGLGVMADDFAAGVYAGAILTGIARWQGW